MTEDVTNKEILDALNNLNSNTVATNNSVKELQEYFILKDKKEEQEKATAKKQEEQTKKEEEELTEQQEKEEASALAEQSARSEAQTETYTELLTDIRDKQELSNDIFAGQLFFTGMIAGLLIGIILWNRFYKA